MSVSFDSMLSSIALQITEWRGKDGTEALLDAHPGGKAMIKHTLSASEWQESLVGLILTPPNHCHVV